ncbi:hypothetical protein BJ165DRAFT_1528832 [Panaeolus papilionaceus]|nr:hypothetical protein BJ165DRAFT_1528832 [Panaeolus papilionaceus]
MVLQYVLQDGQDGEVIDDPADPAPPRLRMARRDSKHFTVTELNIIKPFRAKFRDIPGFEYQERAAYLRKHVFPPLLSHWYRNPETKHRTNNTNIDIWTDRIAAYTSANWRSKIQLYKPPTLRLTISDYFYNYRFKEVLEKARHIVAHKLGPDAALTSKLTTEYRHRAVREILANYTPEQKAEAERARRAVTEQGYSPELQARQWQKHGEARLKHAQHMRMIELGISSLQLCAAPRLDGGIEIYLSENFAQHYGYFGAQPFYEKYAKEVLDFSQLIVNYVEEIRNKMGASTTSLAVQQDSVVGTAPGVLEEAMIKQAANSALKTTPLGFPILPTQWDPAMVRTLVEKYWAAYINTHYALVCGRGKVTVPWTAFKTNGVHTYVDEKYLKNSKFTFKHYRSMDTNDMLDFLRAAAEIQEKEGADNIFIFKAVHKSKLHPITPALYPTGEEPVAAGDSEGEINPEFVDVQLGKRAKRKEWGRAGDQDIRSTPARTDNMDATNLAAAAEQQPTNTNEPAQQMEPPGNRSATDAAHQEPGPSTSQTMDTTIECAEPDKSQRVLRRSAQNAVETTYDHLVDPHPQPLRRSGRNPNCSGPASKYPTPFSERGTSPGGTDRGAKSRKRK